MATVVSYQRFSTTKQALGDSERRQLENGQAWIAKHNHKESEIAFIDRGKSGFRGNKQKALDALLKAIESRKIAPGTILLVESIDRLSRKGIRATQNLVNSILDAGIDIAILFPLEKTYKASNDSIGDAIELAAFAYQANIYSQILSERITAFHFQARKESRATGKAMQTAICPHWLTRTKDGEFLTNDAAVKVIKHIFDQTIKGIGSGYLCKELNENFPKPDRLNQTKGIYVKQHWNKTHIRDLIRNRAVLGDFQPHVMEDGKRVPLGETWENYYPPIIDEKIWDMANAAMDSRSLERGPSGDFVNLFTGMVVNGFDGSVCQITGSSPKHKASIRRIKSQAAVMHLPGSCLATIDLVRFEWHFLQSLYEIDLSFLSNSKTQTTDLSGEIAKKRNRLKELQSKLATDPDLDFLIGTIKQLKAEIEKLEATNRSQALPIGKLDQSLDLSNREHRQMLRASLKTILSKIVVWPKKVGTNRNSPIATLVEMHFVDGTKKAFLIYRNARIERGDGTKLKPGQIEKQLELAAAAIDSCDGKFPESPSLKKLGVVNELPVMATKLN